jgi:hypothetical protein
MNIIDVPRWLAVMLGVDQSLFKTREERDRTIRDAEKVVAANNPAGSVTPFQGMGI